MTRCAWGSVVLLAAGAARAEDIPDVRSPTRFGFAYTGITRAPEASLSWGLELDVVHITPRLTVQLVAEAEVNSRPDLPDTSPVSSLSDLGAGAGLFYVTSGSVAVGFDATAALTFDANDLVGGGFGVRAYVYPFYMRLGDSLAERHRGFAWWAGSSIAIWAMARVDWTGDGNGGTLAFGVSLDLVRIFFVPYVEALTTAFK
jgi:hypothetical protein